MRKRFVLAAICALPSAAHADSESSVKSAYALCETLDRTGMTSAPCEVSGWGSRVTTVIDMQTTEAQKTCRNVASIMRDRGFSFDQGWTLQIKSPYSGDNSIAFCKL